MKQKKALLLFSADDKSIICNIAMIIMATGVCTHSPKIEKDK